MERPAGYNITVRVEAVSSEGKIAGVKENTRNLGVPTTFPSHHLRPVSIRNLADGIPVRALVEEAKFVADDAFDAKEWKAPEVNPPERIAYLLMNIRRLLDQVGGKGKCKGCDKEIWYVTLRSGKMAPYTADALNHFADCPRAGTFRK